MSDTLIKSLRESSTDMSHKKDAKPIDSLEVICFFPRILSEVEVSHKFILKKK